MILHPYFIKYTFDPYAIYDACGDRFYTGGLESIERLLYVNKILEERSKL